MSCDVATSKPRAGFRTCEQCQKNRQERFFTPQGRVCSTCKRRKRKGYSRQQHLAETYNLTLGEYDALLGFQGRCCAICSGTRAYNLHVGHDHKVERETGDSRASIRGLLCARCNKLLAKAGDSIDLLLSAAAYLREPPAREVLF